MQIWDSSGVSTACRNKRPSQVFWNGSVSRCVGGLHRVYIPLGRIFDPNGVAAVLLPMSPSFTQLVYRPCLVQAWLRPGSHMVYIHCLHTWFTYLVYIPSLHTPENLSLHTIQKLFGLHTTQTLSGLNTSLHTVYIQFTYQSSPGRQRGGTVRLGLHRSPGVCKPCLVYIPEKQRFT